MSSEKDANQVISIFFFFSFLFKIKKEKKKGREECGGELMHISRFNYVCLCFGRNGKEKRENTGFYDFGSSKRKTKKKNEVAFQPIRLF